MLHSPSSFEVSKPSLAGISRCVQEKSSTPDELSSHSNYLLSCCLCSARKLPVFTGKDSIEMMEMACFWLPLPRLAAPQPFHGVRRFTHVPIYRPKTPVFWALLSPEDCDFWVGWLTYQARYVRVTIPRRALHASCGSSCHLSAKHRLLDTCFLLTVPFRAMLLTS